MERVTLVFVTNKEHGKQMIGIGGSIDKAIKLIKKSGYGFDMSEEDYCVLALTNQITVNNLIFKLETWEVH